MENTGFLFVIDYTFTLVLLCNHGIICIIIKRRLIGLAEKVYTKFMRFDDKGFYSKPYNSDWEYDRLNHHCHVLPFINYEVKSLDERDIVVEECDLISPEINDEQWSGCFAFLNTFDERLFENAMHFRRNHKKNIAYLLSDLDEIVWVRNSTHEGRLSTYVSKYSQYWEEHNQTTESYITGHGELYWVKMKLGLALKRIELGLHDLGWSPEWLTEVFLTKDQVNKLKEVPSRKFFKLFG